MLLVTHGAYRRVEASNFGFDLLLRDAIVRRLELRVRDEVGMPNGDSTRHRNAMQREAHEVNVEWLMKAGLPLNIKH